MSRRALFPLLVLGRGRAGSALVAALESTGAGEVLGWSRALTHGTLERRLARARTLVLAVADEALPNALEEHVLPAWPKGAPSPSVALHLAGAWPSARIGALAPLGVSLGVFHPVVAISGARSANAFAGAGVTLSGDAPAIAAGRTLARLLAMRPSEIEDARRPLMHLGAVMAAGDLVALLHLAEEVVVEAGLAREDARRLVAELARSATAGYARRGGLDALTGPVARADQETLSRHAAAARAASLQPAPRAAHALLASAGASLLEAGGRLDPDAARAIRALLDKLL